MNYIASKHFVYVSVLFVLIEALVGCGGGSSVPSAVASPGRVAVVTYQGPQEGVLTLAPDGTDVRVVIPGSTGGNAVRFSPDRSQLVTVEGSGTSTIVVLNADVSAGTSGFPVNSQSSAGNTGLLGQNPSGNPAFSADGSSVLYTDGVSLISVTLKGNHRSVTPIAGGGGQSYFTVVPSPDGRRILLGAANYSGLPTNAGTIPRIVTINPDGTNLRVITSGNASEANWSPDSQTIVYTLDHHIWKAPASGVGTPIQLTNGPGADRVPVFSPDGASILFASTRDTPGSTDPFNGSHLYRMNADGSNPVRLAGAGGALTGVLGIDWR